MGTAMNSGVVIHIAGSRMQQGLRLRQVCSWCGLILVDENYGSTAQLAEHAGQPIPSWPESGLVAVDGGASWTVDLSPDDEMPPNSCVNLGL